MTLHTCFLHATWKRLIKTPSFARSLARSLGLIACGHIPDPAGRPGSPSRYFLFGRVYVALTQASLLFLPPRREHLLGPTTTARSRYLRKLRVIFDTMTARREGPALLRLKKYSTGLPDAHLIFVNRKRGRAVFIPRSLASQSPMVHLPSRVVVISENIASIHSPRRTDGWTDRQK